jgi:DNA-binding transcriptional LysR family regulator
MSDRLGDIEAFVRVVEAGTFSAAAERLEMGKSAVSRRIADLEARLGVQLFHRTTRRISLTDIGREYYERSVRLLQDLEEAAQSVSRAHVALRGRLRVALPLTFGLRHLSAAICEFQALHPGVEFDLDFNDRRVDLLEEGFDLAIRIGKLEDSSLIARRLTTIRTVICASPAYLQAHGMPAIPADLAQHTALVYTNVPDADTWTWWDSDGASHRIKLKVGLRSNNGEFIGAAAKAGYGVTMSPTFIVYDAIAAGELIPLFADYSWPRSGCFAVYPPTRHLSQRVRAFVDFLAERFAGTPYWDERISG